MELFVEEKLDNTIAFSGKIKNTDEILINNEGDISFSLLLNVDVLNLTIEEMERLLFTAKNHKRKCSKILEPEYEYDQLVKVNAGRHKGKTGRIKSLKHDTVMVDFGGEIVFNDVSHRDQYWVKFEDIDNE